MTIKGIPPLGTICVDCNERPAKIYAGSDPICWECDGSTSGAPLTATTMAKLEKLATGRGSKTSTNLLAVARLLQPRKYKPRKKKEPAVPQDNNCASSNYVPSSQVVEQLAGKYSEVFPKINPMSDKYSAVIEDLNEKRETLVNQSYLIQDKIKQIDSIVTALQTFQAMV